MAETKQNATIYQGEYKILRFTLEDDFDPTDIPLYYRIAQQAQSATKVLVERDAITNDGNVVSVPLESEDTEGLREGDWYHELYLVDTPDRRSVLATGILTIIAAQAAKHEE